jgi:hypothetical protein
MLSTPSNNVMFIDATYCIYAERFGNAMYAERFGNAKYAERFGDAKYAERLGECLCTQEGEEL